MQTIQLTAQVDDEGVLRAFTLDRSNDLCCSINPRFLTFKPKALLLFQLSW